MTLTTLSAGPQAGDKCLSVKQPWAALIVQGVKKIENRSRSTKFRGRLWIQSSRILGVKNWSEIVGVRGDNISLPALSSLTLGAIVGSVELYDCRKFWDLEESEINDPFAEPGGYCWLLREPQVLAKPATCCGSLGIWVYK